MHHMLHSQDVPRSYFMEHNCKPCWSSLSSSCELDVLLQEFVPVARELEKNWTRFSPHYIVWVCPRVYRQSAECQSQCIHQGRYCTPDPDGDLGNGYSGSDVVQVSNASSMHVFACHVLAALNEQQSLPQHTCKPSFICAVH